MTPRGKLGFALGWVAILLRMASDWLFPQGGPLPYQAVQAVFLCLGVASLWPNLDAIFLTGGQHARSLRQGILALPVGLVLGVASAYARFAAPRWPALNQIWGPIANNVFFSAVEELEFRGFLLALLLRFGMPAQRAVWLQALVHTLAHAHRLWEGGLVSLLVTLLITAWFGFICVRTRSLWGAWVAHLSWNIGILLPELGTGLNIR